jgi:hypothetical protein
MMHISANAVFEICWLQDDLPFSDIDVIALCVKHAAFIYVEFPEMVTLF